MNTLNTLMPVARMFDALAGNLEAGRSIADENVRHSPRADILEGEKEFRILMDLPGVRTSEVEISLEGQVLTVKAQRASSVPDGLELRRHERPGPVSFSRSFSLGAAIDQSAIAAGFENGVLQLTLPKSERSLPRRIEVR
jgi:HSP20 family protein